MITKLTPEQEAQLDNYVDKWRAIFLSTEPTDHVIVENAINRVYQTLGYEQPIEIIWFDSPMAMSKEWKKLGQFYSILNNHRDDLGILSALFEKFDKMIAVDVQRCPTEAYVIIRNVLRAVLDITKNHAPPIYTDQSRLSNIFLYNLCNEVFSFDLKLPLLDSETEIVKQTLWWYPLEDVCLVSERRIELHYDELNRLHCEVGLAVGYPDGWGIYAWHGVHVPKWVIMEPEKIIPFTIKYERNIEIARVMLERYGIDNFLHDGHFNIAQSDDYGDLYRIEFENGDEPIVAVHVKDASTDRDYFLYVPPHVRTAHEGVAWTFGYDNVTDYNPNHET